jgi:hypothetical protein
MPDQLPVETVPVAPISRLLTAAEFHRLADVPPEVEWFANISNAHTRRAYEHAVGDFMRFAGIERPQEFRKVTRAHIIAWRDDLMRRGLGGATIRHRLASLASLFEYLCQKKCRHPQPGQRRRTAEDGIRRRQDTCDWRPPGAQATRRAGQGHHQEQARPRHSVHAAVSCAAPRGIMQA